MCHPIVIGAAIGAATSAITGQDPLLGAVMGAAGGAFGGLSPSGFTAGLGSTVTAPGVFTVFGSTAVSNAAMAGMAMTGLAGGMAMNMLSPQQQDYNLANTGMPYTPQAYNTQHAKVTGSGGRQAAAVLASEIKQAKKLRQRQAGAEDYGLGMATTGTGLQLA